MCCPSRRQFLKGSLTLAGYGLLAGCGIVPAATPKPARTPRVGFLAAGSGDPESWAAVVLRALSERGWVEGQSMLVEWRSGESVERLPALATELVALEVDVIVPLGNPAAQAAKASTSAIPIVLLSHTDPVGTGLVASLARPGGNITGTTNDSPLLAGKRLQTLQDIVPGAARVAYLVNPGNSTSAAQEKELLEAAATLGVDLLRLEVRSPADLEAVMDAAVIQRAAGFVLLSDGLVLVPERARIAQLALQRRLPGVFTDRRGAEVGGLIAYGVNATERYEATAVYVDKILKGARPADLPIEGPTHFDYVINLGTARAIGLTIPSSAVLRATDIIQ